MRWAQQYYSALIHLFDDVPIEVLVGHCAFYAVLIRIHVHSFNYMQWAYYAKKDKSSMYIGKNVHIIHIAVSFQIKVVLL